MAETSDAYAAGPASAMTLLKVQLDSLDAFPFGLDDC